MLLCLSKIINQILTSSGSEFEFVSALCPKAQGRLAISVRPHPGRGGHWARSPKPALLTLAIANERDGALLNPGHVLAAADADRATFDADRGGAKLEEMSGIAVAVVDVVQSPGPSPRSIRHQTVENRDADKRAAALRRVRIVLVCPRPAGLRIDRGSRGGDSRAQGATARSDLHVGAVLRQPKALGIGRRRSCAKQRTKRHGGRSTKPWKLRHDRTLAVSVAIARAVSLTTTPGRWIRLEWPTAKLLRQRRCGEQ